MLHIYALTDTRTGIPYVGLTTTPRLAKLGPRAEFAGLPIRFAEHLGHLTGGYHCNAKLQAEWDNGLTAADLDFQIIETLPKGTTKLEAERIEVQWMKAFPQVYNIKGLTSVYGERVSDADMDHIKSLLAQGYKGKDVASMTGYSTGTISLIKTGKLAQARAERAAMAEAKKAAMAATVAARREEARIRRNAANRRRSAAKRVLKDAQQAALMAVMYSDPLLTKSTGKINVAGTLRKHGRPLKLTNDFARYIKQRTTP